MPPSDIIAHVAPGSAWWDIPTLVGPIVDDRPFVETLSHVVSTEPLSCDRLDYVAPPLSTLHPSREGFYFVGDLNHQTEDIGDVLTWSRRWATIPASRRVPAGSYPFRFPGLPAGSVGSSQAVTGMTFTAPAVLTVATHGFSAGASLFVTLNYTASGSSTFIQFFTLASAVTTNTITINRYFFGSGYAFVSGTVSAGVPTRGPKTLKTSAVEVFDYALPGVTAGITEPEDFTPLDEFAPISVSGSVVSDTDTLDTDTVPTAAEYLTLLANRRQIIAESSVSKYLGEILERRTVYILAR